MARQNVTASSHSSGGPAPVTYCPPWCVLVKGVEHPEDHYNSESYSQPEPFSVQVRQDAREMFAAPVVLIRGGRGEEEVEIELTPSAARSLIRHVTYHCDVADGLIKD